MFSPNNGRVVAHVYMDEEWTRVELDIKLSQILPIPCTIPFANEIFCVPPANLPVGPPTGILVGPDHDTVSVIGRSEKRILFRSPRSNTQIDLSFMVCHFAVN